MKSPIVFLVLIVMFIRPEIPECPAIPVRIKSCIESRQLSGYKIDPRVNPFYLRGDFDGDGKPDFAVTITSETGRSPDSKLGAQAKGEVIALNWEDGVAYIYWDGNQWLARGLRSCARQIDLSLPRLSPDNGITGSKIAIG